MNPNPVARHTPNLIEKPERIGPALAQVVHIDGDQKVTLGQAWLATTNRLVTCGHVVDRFATNPNGLFVFFPSSGKRYAVQSVQLHPSFVRQPDGLVRFDAAVLHVTLTPPESLALPLPFSYEQKLTSNRALWTIRYPVHLGQLSAAMQPLPQDGHFLGLLRKHDNFHLLHDIPLAPGDSGAPICDGKSVIAMHCGDTATLPGLNLPTTSIRLALWVDALRELGLQETRRAYLSRGSQITAGVAAFAIAFAVGLAGFYLSMKKDSPSVQLLQPQMAPVRVSFNKPLDEYKPDDLIELVITPKSSSFISVFLVNDEGSHVLRVYPQNVEPQPSTDSVVVNAVDGPAGSQHLTAGKSAEKFYVVARDAQVFAGQPLLLKKEELVDARLGATNLTEAQLQQHLQSAENDRREAVFYHCFRLVPKSN